MKHIKLVSNRERTIRYITMLCIWQHTSMKRLSLAAGHGLTYFHSALAERTEGLPHQRYWKALGKLLCIPPRFFQDEWSGENKPACMLLAHRYELIKNRADLLLWLRCVAAFEGTTIDQLSVKAGHKPRYIKSSFDYCAPGSTFKQKLFMIAKVIHYTPSKLTCFANLPRISVSVSRHRVVHFAQCAAWAIGTSFAKLSQEQDPGDNSYVRSTLLYGSDAKCRETISNLSIQMQLPSCVFLQAMSGAKSPYAIVRGLALASTCNRRSLNRLIIVLAACLGKDVSVIEHECEYNDGYISRTIYRDYSEKIKQLLLEIHQPLQVSRAYMLQALKDAHIPSKKRAYDIYNLLRSYISCCYLIQHTTVQQKSNEVYGSPDTLSMMLANSRVGNLAKLYKDAPKLQLSQDSLKALFKHDMTPLRQVLFQMRMDITDRGTLVTYVRGLLSYKHCTLAKADRLLDRKSNYVVLTLKTGHREIISRMLTRLSAALHLDNKILQDALDQTNIPHAAKAYGEVFRKQKSLDDDSRAVIMRQLHVVINQHGYSEKKLSKQLYPGSSSASPINDYIRRGSRDTMIKCIALVLVTLHETAAVMYITLVNTNMKFYYPALRSRMQWLENKRTC